MDSKRCTKCKKIKPFSGFYRDKLRSTGRRSHCKACIKLYNDKVKERMREYQRAWYLANKEEVLARGRVHYAENREEILAKRDTSANKAKAKERGIRRLEAGEHKEYRRLNKEKVKKAKETWNKAHSNYYKEYYIIHKEKVDAYAKKWRARNPDKVRAKGARRRARVAGARGSFTGEEWKALKDKFGCVCLACGKRESEVQLTVDHVVPLAKGGSNSIDNIQPLCSHCNKSKGVKIIDCRKEKV